MMQVQEIEVIINTRGHVSFSVKGVKGMDCLELTIAMEQALGGKVQHREMTHEAHELIGEADSALVTRIRE